jgi:hypothetical protein
MTHPYFRHEGSELWHVLDTALAELEHNQDIELRTKRELVLGFICDAVTNATDRASVESKRERQGP